ncbi:MAG TPA: heavy metal-binding domain-containing protein [Allosphingosinicella sp.]|jgi:uncharacterized protein YbjQ (UPF0145 family)|nr:heavy metal-binding domain-containing protein [Allosphingosinicella sp.]
MGLLSGLFGRGRGQSAEARARLDAWSDALASDTLPSFVEERLESAAAGRSAWVATMTPAELLLARSHGIRPVATVSGTCWYQYGWSWTQGHEEGWRLALERIRREAAAAGANAVVDVRMRTLRHAFSGSMDFTLLGTAIKVDRLPPSRDPVVATVPALEFVRLLEAGIVPVGIAVGAQYDWMDNSGGYGGWSNSATQQTQWASRTWTSQPLYDLTDFWERIRREAHAELRRNAGAMGNGVLAHVQFGQIIRQERDKQPPNYLGRHIVIGTVVDTPPRLDFPFEVEPVIDMRDDLSPLRDPAVPRHSSYEADITDQEGGI